MEKWKIEQANRLDAKAQSYSDKEKLKVSYTFLRNAIHVVPEKINDAEQLKIFQLKVEELIDTLPIKVGGSEIDVDSFLSKLNTFKKDLKKDYQIVSKGTYLTQGVVGMPVGLLIGFFVGSIALGMLLGLTIGLGIGSMVENKAKKEGRVI